jgi:hypothetical protein
LAEIESQIAAIACALIGDDIWYLSTFWARPDQQRKGVGMPLLRALWDAGKAAGATTFFTHSSPDMTAMGAYMKLGMLPGYEAVPLEKEVAMKLDQQVRGSRREPDHEYWLGTGGLQGRQVLRHGKVVGYYYLGKSGIGPAAWNGAKEAEGVLALACREAIMATPEMRFAVPGINHTAPRFAIDSKLQVVGVCHFLTTAPFGRMEQYLPSGPSLF